MKLHVTGMNEGYSENLALPQYPFAQQPYCPTAVLKDLHPPPIQCPIVARTSHHRRMVTVALSTEMGSGSTVMYTRKGGLKPCVVR